MKTLLKLNAVISNELLQALPLRLGLSFATYECNHGKDFLQTSYTVTRSEKQELNGEFVNSWIAEESGPAALTNIWVSKQTQEQLILKSFPRERHRIWATARLCGSGLMRNRLICVLNHDATLRANNRTFMTRKLIMFGALLLVTYSLAVGNFYAQANSAQAGAQSRTTTLIALLNSYNAAGWKRFIGENFTKEALVRVPAETRFNTIAKIYDRTRGLILKEIRLTKPNELSAVVTDKVLGERFELLIRFDEAAPYQITAMGFQAQQKSSDLTQKLTDRRAVAKLDQFLKKLSSAEVFSGTVLLAKGDQILFEKAYGEANKDFKIPNNVKTKFNLGSMNKMFTAVSVAQLVELGKLSFDDSLSKFMPDFPSSEAASKIRIKHLLTHTSGLGSYFNEKFFNSSRTNYRSIDDYLELVRGEKPDFEPGTRWSYSNTGMLILGKIIEKVSGRNYFDYIRENIYQKAGMTESDSYELDRVNRNLAVGYTKEFAEKGVEYRNNIFLHVISGGPAGGGYSTVEDLLKFARALQNGVLLKPETLRMMRTPKPELSSPDYGYGFILDPKSGTFGHGGDFLGVSANLEIFSETGYTAVVLSNYDGTRQMVGTKIRELIQSRAK